MLPARGGEEGALPFDRVDIQERKKAVEKNRFWFPAPLAILRISSTPGTFLLLDPSGGVGRCM